MAAGVIAIGLLSYWYFSRRDTQSFSLSLGLCLMIGGAAGNLVDRVRLGGVIDFIDLHVRSYHWPAFNIADSAVSVGALLVALGVMRSGKPQSS